MFIKKKVSNTKNLIFFVLTAVSGKIKKNEKIEQKLFLKNPFWTF